LVGGYWFLATDMCGLKQIKLSVFNSENQLDSITLLN
jgi:hypothetical protein